MKLHCFLKQLDVHVCFCNSASYSVCNENLELVKKLWKLVHFCCRYPDSTRNSAVADRSLEPKQICPPSVISSLRHTIFSDIWLQKCCDVETLVTDLSWSLDMSPFDRAHVTSDWRSIVTMALSRVIVSEIFNVEKCRDLEIWVRGHSRSFHSIDCMVSY